MFASNILRNTRRVAASLQTPKRLVATRQISTTSMLLEDREVGTLKFFNRAKGYGFIIRPNDQGDIFVHASNFRQENTQRLSLPDDTVMEYEVADSERDLDMAVDITAEDGADFEDLEERIGRGY